MCAHRALSVVWLLTVIVPVTGHPGAARRTGKPATRIAPGRDCRGRPRRPRSCAGRRPLTLLSITWLTTRVLGREDTVIHLRRADVSPRAGTMATRRHERS